MSEPVCSDGEFVSLFEAMGAAGTARHLGINLRNVYDRRARLEGIIRRQITSPNDVPGRTRVGASHPERVKLETTDGIVLVGSDGHYWPGEAPVAHRALVQFIERYRPAAVVMNGDAFDGARVSRHPPIGWEDRPEVEAELSAVKIRLGEIESVSDTGTYLVWPLGNHDGRFETRLATNAKEYAKVHGFHLKDHFSDRWQPCWSCWINEGTDSHTVIKHRFRGGEHNGHNNTLRSGVHMVTGHDHALKVTPFTDYRGTRWGVGCGTLADPFSEQFRDYTEDNPRNHRSGFAVLTYRDGHLLTPEIVSVYEHEPDCVVFRGEVIRV